MTAIEKYISTEDAAYAKKVFEKQLNNIFVRKKIKNDEITLILDEINHKWYLESLQT